jgi:hypothetical protein
MADTTPRTGNRSATRTASRSATSPAGNGGSGPTGNGGTTLAVEDPAPAEPAPPLPALIPGDWTDDRTLPDDRYYPFEDVAPTMRRSAQVPRAAGRVVRGVTNQTPITYGNRVQECRDFLNSKDSAPFPEVRMADQALAIGRGTLLEALVWIVDTFHYLAIMEGKRCRR